eukprot:6193832-Pleurochrysis_carterae.AAC.3
MRRPKEGVKAASESGRRQKRTRQREAKSRRETRRGQRGRDGRACAIMTRNIAEHVEAFSLRPVVSESVAYVRSHLRTSRMHI